MFGKRKESGEGTSVAGRYRVESFDYSTVGKRDADALFEEMLNAGDARGWRLVRVNTTGLHNLRQIIVWDTDASF